MADQQAVVEHHPRDGAQPARKTGDPDGHDPARRRHCQQGDDLILNYAVIAQQPYARIKQEQPRSEEHTSELQSLMRISYAVFCLKKNTTNHTKTTTNTYTTDQLQTYH